MRFGTSFASCRFGSSNARSVVGIAVIPEPEPIPPVEPSGASLVVTWVDNSAIEDGFRIRRRLTSAGGAYTLAATVGPNIEAATLTGLAYGTSYDVTVAAFNGAGEYSTVGPITRYTPPEFAPTALTAGAITSSTVAVGFTAAAGVSKYQGYYRAGTSGAWLAGPSITSGTSISFTGLTHSTAYQFKIRGYFTNPDIEGVAQTSSYSPDSTAMNATTGAAQVFFAGYDNQQFTTGSPPAGYVFTQYSPNDAFIEWGGGSYSPKAYWQSNSSPCRVVLPSHAPQDEAHYKFTSWQTSGSNYTSFLLVPGICSFIASGSALVLEDYVENTGWGGGGTSRASGTLGFETNRTFWFDYKKGTGANDTLMRLSWSTGSTKPTVFDSSNSVTYLSNHASQVSGLVFHSAPTANTTINSVIGSPNEV